MDIWWNYLIIGIYIFAGITLFFNLFNKKHKYGQVFNENNKPVKGVILSLNDSQTGKLLSKRVTDNLGRYRFVVRSGMYNLAVMNSDFKLVNEDSLKGIKINKDKGKILSPKIVVKKLEDSSEVEDVIEPLKEL